MIISVDKNEILKSKVTESDLLMEAYNDLMKNNAPINAISFIDTFKNCSKNTKLENLSYLYQINTVSSFNLLKLMIETSDMSRTDLEHIRECSINWFCSHNVSAENQPVLYSDDPKMVNIIDCIDKKIKEFDDLNERKLDIQYKFDCERVCDESVTTESYLSDDLDVIMFNINENPEVIADFEKIVRDIKLDNSRKYYRSYTSILKSSTNIVRNIRISIRGDVLDLMTSVPTVIADKIIQLKLTKPQITAFIRIYEKHIHDIYKDLKQGDATKYNVLSTYVKKLVDAKEKLKDHSKMIPVAEHIADMQPEVAADNIRVTRELRYNMEDKMLNIIFDDMDDDNLLEAFSDVYELAENYVLLTEDGLYGRPSNAVRRTQNMANATRKAGVKIQGAVNNANRKKVAMSKSFEPIINSINKVVNDIKQKDKDARTEEIISGKYRFNLLRVIRTGILAIAGATVGVKATKYVAGKTLKTVGKAILKGSFGPLVAILLTAIGILTGYAIDKKIQAKHRQRILNDLQSELKMVKEKIEDAKGDGEREKKYQLMRIEQKLEKDIERIKFNLK